MCGIAGIVAPASAASAATQRAAAAAMIERLGHRGPDDAGIAGGPGWALGMTRLAVQDLSRAGAQPMTRGALTLVYNGEIYDAAALRAELAAAGYAFGSRSDTEVVLHALHRWGIDALARLNGMFALALVDERRGTLLLARDRFGKKPLFVADVGGRRLFASELTALLPVAGRELTLDRDALAAYFGLQYVPAPRAIFRQARKLAPASWLQIDLATGRDLRSGTFWSLPAKRPGSAAATPEEIHEAIGAATRRRLVADVPVGAFLSGGTDSSLVVAAMRDAGGDVRTFSIGFEDPRFDESAYARRVAEHLQTTHTHHRLGAAEALALVPRLATAYDEPFADSSAIPTMAVAALARRDVTVALSGDGGDELFGGYARYAAARVVRAARWVPGVVGRLAASGARHAHPSRRVDALAGMAACTSSGAAYQQLVSVWRGPELLRLMPGAQRDDSVARAFERAPGRAVERMMRADARTYLVDDILQKVDRATMAVSLEARNPLLDPAVVALGLRSADVAAAGAGAKPLLKDVLRLRLPDALVDRPKMGFGVPVGDWMRGELRELVEDLVLGRREAEYDVATAHAVTRAHLSGARDATPQVWSLLSYELWRARWQADAGLRAGAAIASGALR